VTYQRFEDLPVWQASMGLLEKVYEFTDAAETQMRRRASLRTQLERATLSISNNIAEGFERGTTNELLGFLYIAKGSAGEVRSMLLAMERSLLFGDFKSQILDLKSQAEGCSRQLGAWAQSLQDSKIKGQRHLNTESRGQFAREQQQEAAEKEKQAFLEQIAAEVKQRRGF
jgi:four helix bundle protein